ncbi:MAG: hypothetical protein IT381_13955 [Deltaproteobacteria bacterium]|nr:hypothetical protein [Deltaproteobacteria bacterium]
MLLRHALILLFLAACDTPTPAPPVTQTPTTAGRDKSAGCTKDDECPTGLTCGAAGRCRADFVDLGDGKRITGHWDFEAPMGTTGEALSATVGADLTLFGDDSYLAVTKALADVDGKTLSGLTYSKPTLKTQALVVRHGLSVNGGGPKVNQYTLIFDMYYPLDQSESFRALYQTNPTNADDADLFLNNTGGIGVTGDYTGVVKRGIWTRVVFVVDLVVDYSSTPYASELANQGTGVRYIDGVPTPILQEYRIAAAYLPKGFIPLEEGPTGRWAIEPGTAGDGTLLIFCDDSKEVGTGTVAGFQIRNYAMSATEVQALGAAGFQIPLE